MADGIDDLNDTKTISCEGCGSKIQSKLSCPQCKKLGLKTSYFCSQACFKENWAIHKLKHQLGGSGKELTKVSSDLVKNNVILDDPRTWVNCPHISKFMGFNGFTGPLRPYPISSRRKVPDHILKPDYADDKEGRPFSELKRKKSSSIIAATPEEIELLRECCKIGREALDIAASMIKPGVTTEAIDEAVHNFIISRNAYPSPLNYWEFPKSCCTSVNEVICHGIPDFRPLEEGDIVNVDISVYYKGVHGDLNETFPVGKVDKKSMKLMKIAYQCLEESIKICKPGTMYREIGNLIQSICDKHGFSVVKTYCGHGVGTLFHCAPNVPHYKNNKAVGTMKPGHVFTIEPMINAGRFEDITWPDDWTSTTLDGERSAQFEHTLLVTETGVEVLTKRTESSPKLEILSEIEY
ncbi:methionine aminopeptidase [Cryptosporidium ubiquitum]|uniref:Methionine aminopeptidase n=1 Tax=Cryptosporidium ubiquitum TaxID=857276 RepID=A0A1J4MKH7_9CRYT|nr:methionine aminopeptidase [Cryptosporidium ubiquitum]OII74712.1 methionine aminopeptidase [Cryptosporidium ubiquitum]